MLFHANTRPFVEAGFTRMLPAVHPLKSAVPPAWQTAAHFARLTGSVRAVHLLPARL
jgi:hypothetical protein